MTQVDLENRLIRRGWRVCLANRARRTLAEPPLDTSVVKSVSACETPHWACTTHWLEAHCAVLQGLPKANSSLGRMTLRTLSCSRNSRGTARKKIQMVGVQLPRPVRWCASKNLERWTRRNIQKTRPNPRKETSLPPPTEAPKVRYPPHKQHLGLSRRRRSPSKPYMWIILPRNQRAKKRRNTNNEIDEERNHARLPMESSVYFETIR